MVEGALGRLAWFLPENIPLLLLDAEMTGRAHALTGLSNLSLIAPARDTTAGPSVTLHRLVQAVMRERLAGQRAVAAAALPMFPAGRWRGASACSARGIRTRRK